MDYRKIALKLVKRNICPIPLRQDSKLPKIKWKKYQTQLPTAKEINENFKDCGGVSALTLAGDADNLNSDLFLFDFDLKYQRKEDEFYEEFMKQVPNDLKKKFLVNTTKNNGMHIWVRSKEFYDKSRKVAFRLKTIPELTEEHSKLKKEGRNEKEICNLLLKNPLVNVLETRGANSYGVLVHEDYKRVQGKEIQYFSKEEMELLMDIGYSLSDYYVLREKREFKRGDFSLIEKYNNDTSAQQVMDMLTSTGMFTSVGATYKGDLKFLRSGSKSGHSGLIFADKSILHLFSHNTILGDATAYNPFQVFCKLNNYTISQALKQLKINKK